MTLTDFLLARIAEDEAALADVDNDPWISGIVDERQYGRVTIPAARILAECKAKRAMLRFLDLDGAPEGEGRYVAQRVLLLLALPYADHPDYEETR